MAEHAKRVALNHGTLNLFATGLLRLRTLHPETLNPNPIYLHLRPALGFEAWLMGLGVLGFWGFWGFGRRV